MKPYQALRTALAQAAASSLCSLLFTAGSLAAADLPGDWEFDSKYLGDVSYARVTLKLDGDKLTGKLNELCLEGTGNGDDLTFTAKRPNGEHFGDFKGSAHSNKLEGTAVWFG